MYAPKRTGWFFAQADCAARADGCYGFASFPFPGCVTFKRWYIHKDGGKIEYTDLV